MPSPVRQPLNRPATWLRTLPRVVAPRGRLGWLSPGTRPGVLLHLLIEVATHAGTSTSPASSPTAASGTSRLGVCGTTTMTWSTPPHTASSILQCHGRSWLRLDAPCVMPYFDQIARRAGFVKDDRRRLVCRLRALPSGGSRHRRGIGEDPAQPVRTTTAVGRTDCAVHRTGERVACAGPRALRSSGWGESQITDSEA
jgi:hypothetical protein